MLKPDYEELARRLRDAYTGETLPPLREWLEPTDAAGAYAIQAINTRFWESQGRRIVGRKARVRPRLPRGGDLLGAGPAQVSGGCRAR